MSRAVRSLAVAATLLVLPVLGTGTARADETAHRPGDVEITRGARTGRISLTWTKGAIENPSMPGTSYLWSDPRTMTLDGDSTGLDMWSATPDNGWRVTVYPKKGDHLVVGRTYVAGATSGQGADPTTPTLFGAAPGYTCSVKPGASMFLVNALKEGQDDKPLVADITFHIACIDDAKGKGRVIEGRAAMSNRAIASFAARPFAIERGADGVLRARMRVSCTQPSVPTLTVRTQDVAALAQAVTERRCTPGHPVVATVVLHEGARDGSGGGRIAVGARVPVYGEAATVDALYGHEVAGSARATLTVRAVRVPHLRR